MHDLGVADELQRDEPERAGDVVVGDRVLVALDRADHEPVDGADPGEARRAIVVGRGEVERAGARPCPARRRGRDRRVRSRSRPVITTVRPRAA